MKMNSFPRWPASAFVLAAVGTLSLGVGGMVLAGWALDVAALKSILPGWVSVKPNTALAFVLTGIAFLLSSIPSGQPSTLRACPEQSRRVPRSVFIASLSALPAGMIGLLTLCEYVFGWNPGFDQWLFSEPAGAVATSNPGRMAPDTALCFVLLSAGLVTAGGCRQRNWMQTPGVSFGALVMMLGVAALTTYFTPAFGAFGWWGLTNMAVPTAALFTVLGGTLILAVLQTGDLNWSLGRKTTAIYACGLALVLLLGLHTSRSALWQRETARRVEHGEQVLNAINDFEVENNTAQSITRGYVISGEDRYLQSQRAAIDRCHVTLAALRQIISDPAQQDRAARLEVQGNELLLWYQKVVEAHRTGATATVLGDMVNHGEDLMNGVRAATAEMEHSEHVLLQERHRRAQEVAQITQVFIATGTLLSLIVFLLVLWGLNRSEARRKESTEKLHRSEIQYRRLFEAARDGVLILDAETGQVVDVNPFMLELLGVTREVFLGKKVWELGLFKDLVANEANFVDLQAKHYIRYEDMALEGHDGKRHEVEFVSNLYLVDGKKVIQCNIRDISERVRATAALRASEEDYRMLFREMQNGFALHEIICDEAGKPFDYRFLAVNPAFERMTGLKAAETVGRTVLEILPDTERSWIERYGKVALTGVPVCFENYAASMKKHFEVVAFRPKINQFACVVSDITARKQAEEQLRQQGEQLQATNEELSRFNRLMTGRELRVIELKQQVNDLAAQLAKPRPHLLAFMDATASKTLRTASKPGEPESEGRSQK